MLWLWTRRFIFGGTIIVLLFDLFVSLYGGPGSSISLQGWYLSTLSFRQNTLMLAIGYLLGHVFGRIDSASAK